VISVTVGFVGFLDGLADFTEDLGSFGILGVLLGLFADLGVLDGGA